MEINMEVVAKLHPSVQRALETFLKRAEVEVASGSKSILIVEKELVKLKSQRGWANFIREYSSTSSEPEASAVAPPVKGKKAAASSAT